MHGCSNIADLNTGVSLQSSPVLKESARYFVGDFAICSKHFKCFALGVQCRCLDINGNSSQGRFRKYGKILEKKKQFREIRWDTEQRERKIYSRTIYIHELSSITEEIIKRDESVFLSFAEPFQGCYLLIF